MWGYEVSGLRIPIKGPSSLRSESRLPNSLPKSPHSFTHLVICQSLMEHLYSVPGPGLVPLDILSSNLVGVEFSVGGRNMGRSGHCLLRPDLQVQGAALAGKMLALEPHRPGSTTSSS